MGLFRRNASKKASDTPSDEARAASAAEDGSADRGTDAADATAVSDGEATPERGPFDASQVTSMGPRVDLGAIWLPVLPGLELRMEIDKKTQKVTGVSATLAGSGLQVQAFAAPRTEGIWGEVRGEIAASVTRQGGTVDDVPGAFGRELIARVPATGPDGAQGVRPARFVGVDGPRWFLRGVLSGRAAVDAEAAKPLESVFANIVVVRDGNPRPPRDLLTLTMPQKPGAREDAPAGPPVDTAADPDATGRPADQTPSFDPLTRGPEITETR